jgi:SAM-dependent methyltransferase
MASFKHRLGILWHEIVLETLRRPRRLLSIFRPSVIKVYAGYLREKFRSEARNWSDRGDSFTARNYASYQEYLAHQTSGLQHLDLEEYDRVFIASLTERLRTLDAVSPGTNALCLGARTGAEVRAFLEVGCFAVGIDINPRAKSPWVLYGDFQALQFASDSVDVIYTNSLDHAFDLKRVMGEARRALKPDGLLIVEMARGSEEGVDPGDYEAFWWESAEDLVSAIEQVGFARFASSEFEQPWRGHRFCLRMA